MGSVVTPGASSPPPGWYPDPDKPGGQRWWSGTEWGERQASPQGIRPRIPSNASGAWWLAVGSAGLMVLGTFMPWARVFIASLSGLNTDHGLIVLICGVVALGAFFFSREHFKAIAAVAGLIGVVLTLWFLIAMEDVTDGELAATGFGGYVSLAGSLGLLVSVYRLRHWKPE